MAVKELISKTSVRQDVGALSYWQNICYFCTMETLIVQPKTKEQLAAIKAFMKALHIDFKSEKPQTLAQYNKDLEKGDAEIEQGKFTTTEDLKTEASKW